MEYDLYMGMFAHHPHLFHVNSEDLSAESFLGKNGVLKHQIHASWRRSPHTVELEALFEPCGVRRHRLNAVVKDYPPNSKSEENRFNVVKQVERFPYHDDDEMFVLVDDVSNDILSSLTSLEVASDDWEEIPSHHPSPIFPCITQHTFEEPFDNNGVLYYLGTCCDALPYQNPHDSGVVTASLSSAGRVGTAPSLFVQHTAALECNYTNNEPNSWMAVDLGEGRSLIPDYYCLRHDLTLGDFNALRHWKLQAAQTITPSNDDWITLQEHINDVSISRIAFAVASWPICVSDELRKSYRHFRILQCGENSSGHHNLTCGGMELYGTLIQT